MLGALKNLFVGGAGFGSFVVPDLEAASPPHSPERLQRSQSGRRQTYSGADEWDPELQMQQALPLSAEPAFHTNSCAEAQLEEGAGRTSIDTRGAHQNPGIIRHNSWRQSESGGNAKRPSLTGGQQPMHGPPRPMQLLQRRPSWHAVDQDASIEANTRPAASVLDNVRPKPFPSDVPLPPPPPMQARFHSRHQYNDDAPAPPLDAPAPPQPPMPPQEAHTPTAPPIPKPTKQPEGDATAEVHGIKYTPVKLGKPPGTPSKPPTPTRAAAAAAASMPPPKVPALKLPLAGAISEVPAGPHAFSPAPPKIPPLPLGKLMPTPPPPPPGPIPTQQPHHPQGTARAKPVPALNLNFGQRPTPPPPPAAPVKPSHEAEHQQVDIGPWGRPIVYRDNHVPHAQAQVQAQAQAQAQAAQQGGRGLSFASATPVTMTPRNTLRLAKCDELKFIQQVGEGGFGKVFYGLWQGKAVAIKLAMLQNSDMAQLQLEFSREVNTMSTIPPHPNILKLLAACVEAPNLALVTEFCSRGSLYNILHSPCTPSMSERLLLELWLGIAQGMTHLHSCQPAVLHRDLKSANILLDDTGNVKIADFGLSKMYQDVQALTGGLGTYQWMAPEVLAHQRYSTKADVYSFGICMWECFARQLPYSGMTAVQAAVGVVNNGLRPDMPPQVPMPLANLIRACWAAVPDQRPSFPQIVSTLQDMLAGKVSGPAVSPIPPLPIDYQQYQHTSGAPPATVRASRG